MKLLNFYFLIFVLFFGISCSKKDIKKSIIQENDLNLQVLEAYKEGKKALDEGDVLFAAKKFNEAEIIFPQSIWAPKSALMAAYAYYIQDYYGDAIAELDRFIKIYPNYKDIEYAYYLLAISYYEQIVDEKKDTQSILKAKKSFEYVINNFPNTEYALDSKFKIDLIDDILASKEMYIGRYYFQKKKWIASINRFRTVIDEYDNTIYTEEALHRLVEIYYTIGLVDEARRYAKLLGYNYQSSEWYKKTYSVFYKNYKDNKIKLKKSKNSKLQKIKSIFSLDD